MIKINTGVRFFVNLAKTHAIAARRFDSGLGGVGFNEFVILYHLRQSEEGKLRRIDLAEKIGLTASGITRLLIPMEKIGLIKRGNDKRDARVSYVALTPGGKQKLDEGLERAELVCDDLIPASEKKNLEKLSKSLATLSQAIR